MIKGQTGVLRENHAVCMRKIETEPTFHSCRGKRRGCLLLHQSVPKTYSTPYFRIVTHPGVGIIQQGLTYIFLFSPKGNALFKEGKYEAAINCYTTGIQLDPSNAVLSANRAMCLLKLKRYVRDEG